MININDKKKYKRMTLSFCILMELLGTLISVLLLLLSIPVTNSFIFIFIFFIPAHSLEASR